MPPVEAVLTALGAAFRAPGFGWGGSGGFSGSTEYEQRREFPTSTLSTSNIVTPADRSHAPTDGLDGIGGGGATRPSPEDAVVGDDTADVTANADPARAIAGLGCAGGGGLEAPAAPPAALAAVPAVAISDMLGGLLKGGGVRPPIGGAALPAAVVDAAGTWLVVPGDRSEDTMLAAAVLESAGPDFAEPEQSLYRAEIQSDRNDV